MFEIAIVTEKNEKDFFQAALNIYENDENWVAPLNGDVLGFFYSGNKPREKKCNFQLWVLYENKIPVGRISAFLPVKKPKANEIKAGGIGFFDCINSQEAANMLFNVAVDWLKAENMQAVDANTVPGENFNHWGVLVDGFIPQAYGMPYNKEYYKELFENYGFQNYFEQYSYHIDLQKPFPQRHIDFAQRVIDSGDFDFKHLDFKQTDKFVDDVTTVFNEVWSYFHADHTKVERKEFEKMFKAMKPIVNPKLVWFVYKDGRPIGMEVCLPDLNQVIKPFKGKLNLFNSLKLVSKIKKVKRARVIVFGVHPDYQRIGVTHALYVKMLGGLREAGVTELEMSWVGDYNQTVNRIYRYLGNSHLAKTHITYRYMIDKNCKFERFTNEKPENQ